MHSDVKARNVLLSGNREVAKISDVGVAKFLNEHATATSQDTYVAWTFAYAVPEILLNQRSGAEVRPSGIRAVGMRLKAINGISGGCCVCVGCWGAFFSLVWLICLSESL